MKPPALISPYVGGKSGPRYQYNVSGHPVSRICDRPHFYDCIVEPFAGSGAVTWQHSHGISHAIASDIDPGVRAVWECWGDASLIVSVEKLIEQVKANPDSTYKKLKTIYHSPREYSPVFYAAAYLTLKKLVFGGVLRCNRQGLLNVALSEPKRRQGFSEFSNWRYRFPNNGIQSLTFKHSWQDAVKALADSSYQRALVVIDSPYYSDKEWVEERHDGQKRVSKMTPAYAKHNPQSDDELRLCIDCLDAVLDLKNVGRIVVFNYGSEALDQMIQDLLIKRHRFDFHVSNLGPLGNMNNAQKFHGRNDEWVWEIGGKRMFQGYDKAIQGNLLEALAS